MYVVAVKILGMPHFLLQKLLLTLISGWSVAEGNPVAEPDHTWDHHEKQRGPNWGLSWDHSGSLGAGGCHFPLRMDLSEDSAAS
jgi:hypothetical protein